MAASTFFLFINGTVLLYVQDDQVSVKRLDILIREGIIVDIDSNIPEPRDNDIEVIDCSNLIISPGLVDTHRHLWQTQLKGRHSDELLLDYIPSGNLTGFFYKPEDVKFGELSGAMESINVGTTTIVDHMHVAYSADHHNAAMMALEASGARVVFCPSPTMRVKEWSPKMLMEEEVMPSWFLPTVQDLANRQASRDGGRVSVGLGFDSYASLPEEDVVKVFAQAKLWNLQLITSHHTHGQIFFDAVGPLARSELMGPDILLSHCNGVTEKEASIVLSSGAYISSTPSTELQMGLGEPVCFQDDLRKVASIGVDCHSATSASLVAEARLALQYTRGRNNQRALNSGSAMSQTAKTLEAFNLITIKGARAAGLGDMTGSIAIGKRADLVFWDKLSPGMLAAGEHDLVAAIMHHSSVEEVRSVMVDGIFRKQDGRLLPVFLHDETTKKMQWKEVAQEVLRSRKRVEWRISDAQRA